MNAIGKIKIGVSYPEALAAVKRGARIRSEFWSTWAKRVGGALVFELPAELAEELGTSCEPLPFERAGTWEIGP